MSSSSAGAGKPKLRQTRKKPKIPVLEARTVFEGSVALISTIRPAYVLEALHSARQQSPDEFRRFQKAWLSANLASLASATEVLYESAARSHGIEIADAALQGALLGSAVLDLAIKDEAISLSECQHNLLSRNIGPRAITYTGEPDPEDIVKLFGSDVAEAFALIKTPAAKTMAETVVAVSCASPNSQ